MRLQHLQASLTLAEEQNFRLAAARLCLSQPGLSEQLQELEGELGVRSFSGTATAIGNTEAGRHPSYSGIPRSGAVAGPCRSAFRRQAISQRNGFHESGFS
jgi:hypothetical protein